VRRLAKKESTTLNREERKTLFRHSVKGEIGLGVLRRKREKAFSHFRRKVAACQKMRKKDPRHEWGEEEGGKLNLGLRFKE